jgi:hypothetical protein
MVSAVVTVLLVVPSVASARVPRCMGHRATIVAQRGRIQIRGTSGRDVIVANAQANYINGRGGRDIICARGGADRVRGGAGNDVVSAGRGSDELWGDLGDDILLGRHGSDIANGDLGDDIIKLGRGRDRLDYETAKPATIDLSTGVANGLGSDVVRGAESVVSAWNATEIDGNAAANRIDVYDAAEGIIVRGYGGNDTISCYGFACVNSQYFGDAGWDVLEAASFPTRCAAALATTISKDMKGMTPCSVAPLRTPLGAPTAPTPASPKYGASVSTRMAELALGEAVSVDVIGVEPRGG